jgi:hypothetical protein
VVQAVAEFQIVESLVLQEQLIKVLLVVMVQVIFQMI